MRRRVRSIYMLDGEGSIPSSRVLGFIHTAKRQGLTLGDTPIPPGTKYVTLNSWMGAFWGIKVPLDQYLADHATMDVVLGERQGRGIYHGIRRRIVYCKLFKATKQECEAPQ